MMVFEIIIGYFLITVFWACVISNFASEKHGPITILGGLFWPVAIPFILLLLISGLEKGWINRLLKDRQKQPIEEPKIEDFLEGRFKELENGR